MSAAVKERRRASPKAKGVPAPPEAAPKSSGGKVLQPIDAGERCAIVQQINGHLRRATLSYLEALARELPGSLARHPKCVLQVAPAAAFRVVPAIARGGSESSSAREQRGAIA